MISLSNWDCSFFHLGDGRLSNPMDSSSATISVLAGGQVDGPKLGIPKQGGDQEFTHRFALDLVDDQVGAMKRALAHQNPLVASRVEQNGKSLMSLGNALIQCESDGCQLWAFKIAEEGAKKGVIARIWNVSKKPSE